MDIGRLSSLGQPGVDDDKTRPIGTVQAVEHAHPEHGLGLGDIDPDEEERVAMFDVAIRPRLSVRAKVSLSA